MLCLFGVPRVLQKNQTLYLPLERPVWLCLYLAARNDWVSRDELACVFRPNDDSSTARNGLRLILHRANKYPWAKLEIQAQRLRWVGDSDLGLFTQALKTQNWKKAIESHTGPFLDGLNPPPETQLEAWQMLEREQFQQQWIEALLEHIATLETGGHLTSANDFLTTLLNADPLCERAIQAQIRLALRSQETAKAHLIYKRFSELLQQELGLQPDAATTALLTPEAASWVHRAFPQSLLPFFGRENQLQHLETWLLAEARLVSLVGLGGVGKTRLALEAAKRLKTHFDDGLVFIDGSALFASHELPRALLHAFELNTPPNRQPEEVLFKFLANKSVLLVLDNFEHLVSTGSWLQSLLKAAANLKILLTSRLPLGLGLEVVLDVAGLESESAGIALFQKTAQRLGTLEINQNQTEQIRQIVQLLEGLPLAIELAAHWTRVLSLSQMLQELRQNQTWLSTTNHDLPARHQSLDAVLSSTWQQLNRQEQTVLMGLSVFHGGSSLAGLRAVAGAELPTLMTLIKQGLVRRDPHDRFICHEMIRQFVSAQCRDLPSLQAKHADFYATCCLTWQPQKRQPETLNIMALEHANLHLAWAFWAEHNPNQILQVIDLLCEFWEVRGQYHQAQQNLNLCTPARGSPLEAAITFGHGVFLRLLGDYKPACEYLEKAVLDYQKLAMPQAQARAQMNIAYIAFEQGQFSKAQKQLEFAKSNFNQAEQAECLNMLGNIAKRQADYPQALLHFMAAKQIYHLTSNTSGLGILHNNIANIYEAQGDFLLAYQNYQEALIVFTQQSHQRAIALVHSNLGYVTTKLGQFQEAKHHLETSLNLRRQLNDQIGEVVTLTNLAQLGLSSQDLSLCKQALYQALPLSQKIQAIPRALEAFRLLGEWCKIQRLPQASAIFLAVREHPQASEETRRWATQNLENLPTTTQTLPLEHWEMVMQITTHS